MISATGDCEGDGYGLTTAGCSVLISVLGSILTGSIKELIEHLVDLASFLTSMKCDVEGEAVMICGSMKDLGKTTGSGEESQESEEAAESGQQHSKKLRVHPWHFPLTLSSSHFFFLLRQVKQPVFVLLFTGAEASFLAGLEILLLEAILTLFGFTEMFNTCWYSL